MKEFDCSCKLRHGIITLKVNLPAIAAVFAVPPPVMKALVLPVILMLSIGTAIRINLSVPSKEFSEIVYIYENFLAG